MRSHKWDSPPAPPPELDALVREAKRVFGSEGIPWHLATHGGMTDKYIRAFNLFLLAAEAGHSEAQNCVGMCYGYGHGVRKDHVEATKWHRKAAEQGYAPAQANLGYWYRYGQPPDHEEAAKWHRKAAEQGYPVSQLYLGYCYRDGQGVPQDYVEAVKWFRRVAEQGYAGGQSGLGDCYLRGHGVPQDYLQAVNWYCKAAEQGEAGAQATLGYCYRDGQGVPIDLLQAYKWFRLAADARYHEKEQEEARRLAALMSPSELKSAYTLYHEFKDQHAAKE